MQYLLLCWARLVSRGDRRGSQGNSADPGTRTTSPAITAATTVTSLHSTQCCHVANRFY